MTPRGFGIPRLIISTAVGGLGRGLFALLLVALPASLSRAQPAPSGDPFAGLDAISLTIEIGGPLDLQGSEAPQLFAGDLRRRKHFELAMSDAIGTKIDSCGIFKDPGVLDILAIHLFGRPEQPREAQPHYVYMVEVNVLNTTLAEGKAAAEPIFLRPVVGLVEDAGLETALIDAAIAIIADHLTCRP